jgi:hypothetical protein
MGPNPLWWVQPRSGSCPAKASFENLVMAAYALGLRGLASRRQLSWMVAMPDFSRRAGGARQPVKILTTGSGPYERENSTPVVVATITE